MKNYAITNLFNVIREYSALIEDRENDGTNNWSRINILEGYNDYLKGYIAALYFSDIITENQYDLISRWRTRQYNRKWSSYLNEKN